LRGGSVAARPVYDVHGRRRVGQVVMHFRRLAAPDPFVVGVLFQGEEGNQDNDADYRDNEY
jgi:hypothetical protein